MQNTFQCRPIVNTSTCPARIFPSPTLMLLMSPIWRRVGKLIAEINCFKFRCLFVYIQIRKTQQGNILRVGTTPWHQLKMLTNKKNFCNARYALIIMIRLGMSAIEPQLTIVALSTSTRRGKSASFPQVKELWKSLNYRSSLTKHQLFQTTQSHCPRDCSKIKTSHSRNALAATTVRLQSVVSLEDDINVI